MSAAPQPLTVITDWGAAGIAPLGALFAAVAVAAVFYWLALRRTQGIPLHLALVLTAGGLAIGWCAPALFSSDVYAYAAYGEMARIGVNAYAQAPVNSPDLVVRAAQLQWVSTFPICVYGPAFLGLARVVVTVFAPLGLLAQLDAFRVLACVGLLLCVVLAYGAFEGDRAARLRCAATIGLNPVAIWCAVEGHNDAIAMSVVLAGLVLVRRRLFAIGAAVVALSGLVKVPGIAAALAIAFAQRRARVGAIAGIAIVLAFSFPLLAAVATRLAPHGTYGPQASLQAIFFPASPFAAWGVALAVSALLAVRGVELFRRHVQEGWIWLGLAAWVLIPNPYPWYALWLIALAALAPSTRVATVAFLLSFTSMLRYIPDAIGRPSSAAAVTLGIVATLPLFALIRSGGWYNERLV